MAFPKSGLLELFLSVKSAGKAYPVSFDKVWSWVYKEKGDAVAHLQKYFFRTVDYEVSGQDYHLTEETFKAFASKEVRLYYVGLEKAQHSLTRPLAELDQSSPMFPVLSNVMVSADAAKSAAEAAEARLLAAQETAERAVRDARTGVLEAQSEAKRLRTTSEYRNRMKAMVMQGCTAGTVDQAVLQGLADSFFARHSRPQATIGVKRKEPDLSVFMTPFGDLPEDPKDWVYPLLIWPVPNQPHSKPPQPLESFRAYAARVGADMDCLGRQRDGWLNYWKDLVPPFVFRGLEEGLTSQVDILKRLARGDDAGLHVLRLSNYAMTLHPTSVAEFSHDVHFSSGGHDPEHWFVQLENPTRRAPVWGLFYDWVKTGGMKAWLPDAADVSSAKRELQGREAAKVPANRQIYPPYSIKPHLVELPSRRSGSLLVSCLRKIAGRAEVVYSVNHACSFCKRRGHEIWSIFITPRGSLACIDCLLKNAPKGRTTLLWEQIYGSQGYRRELPVSRGLEGEGGSVSERAPAQGPLTKEGGEQESTVSHPKARVGAVRVHPMTTRHGLRAA